MKSGCVYIFEDLHTSYWTGFGGGGSRECPLSFGNTTVAFLKSLIDDVNFVGAARGRASNIPDLSSLKEQLNEYRLNILGMHFYDSICVVIKK